MFFELSQLKSIYLLGNYPKLIQDHFSQMQLLFEILYPKSKLKGRLNN